MQIIDGFVMEAINVVITWDLPDAALAEAVTAQACIMAGVHPEEIGELCSA